MNSDDSLEKFQNCIYKESKYAGLITAPIDYLDPNNKTNKRLLLFESQFAPWKKTNHPYCILTLDNYNDSFGIKNKTKHMRQQYYWNMFNKCASQNKLNLYLSGPNSITVLNHKDQLKLIIIQDPINTK